MKNQNLIDKKVNVGELSIYKNISKKRLGKESLN